MPDAVTTVAGFDARCFDCGTPVTLVAEGNVRSQQAASALAQCPDCGVEYRLTVVMHTTRSGMQPPHRFDIDPLYDFTRTTSPSQVATRLGMHRGTVQLWAREGIPLEAAENAADRLKANPAAIWPDWVDVIDAGAHATTARSIIDTTRKEPAA